MVNISLTLYTKVFLGSFLKSPTQMGLLSINNSVTNISRLGTFKKSTYYSIPHAWNELAPEIKLQQNAITFKWALKAHLLESLVE